MDKEIRRLAIENAHKYQGRANPGSIIGSLIANNPKVKENIKEISKKVDEIVKEVNSLGIDAIEKEYNKLNIKEKKVEKKNDLPELKNIRNIVTRIPPEPSKYPHIGHALSFLINYLYAKKYNGKCVLRFDDTNPEKAKKEYYDAVEDMLKWLNVKYNKKVIASNDMEKFYKYAEQLIKQQDAYVCFCREEEVHDLRGKTLACNHRSHNVEKNLEVWNDMLKGKYKEGDVTLRLMGDMTALNAVMRDPILFRISKATHPLQKNKYLVWPMYDFETVIEEELCGITHVFRDINFGEMRKELQNYIKDLLKFKKQEITQYGRFNVLGATTQGREIREMIEKKQVSGWDDPRLVTIMALRRRGFVPEMFHELVYEVGISESENNLDWTRLYSINRRLIDPIAKRFFFIEDPRKIKIEHNLKNVEVSNHPENKKLGKRKLKLTDEFYVAEKIETTRMYRFMNLFNFQAGKFISKEHDNSLNAKIIEWIPVKEAIDIKILMNDGKWIAGKSESNLKNLKEGDIIQFQKKFFCRLGNKEKMEFVYTHD